MKIALQLYTIRDCISDKQSFFKALEEVKAAGYEGVEFAGFYDTPAAELAQKLKELSLTPVCCHVSTNELNDITGTIQYLKEINCKAVALAWSETSTLSQLSETCELIKKAAAKASEAGVRLYYHNHDHEFKHVEGIMPLEKIMDCCPLELDTFWSFVAGHSSANYLREIKNSVGLVHLKDGIKDKKHPCALGEGENDIVGITNAAKELGYEWIIVENDVPTPDGLSDVKRSIAYLNKII